jgi:Flp pilus assembly CpaE family ATPase
LFAPSQEGAGASTTALHAAAALHRTHGLRTLFTEMDYHSDAIAYRLRFPLVKSLAELDAGENWRIALTHWEGLHVLPAPQARALRRRGLPNLVDVLEDTGYDYDVVIGDLPCNTAAATPDVLSRADRIYVVATAEVTSLYLARRRISEVCTVGGKREAIRLIINRDRPGAIDSEVARQVTGLAPSCRLPNDYAAASEAETEAWTVNPASALGQAYETLAADILGKPAPVFQPPARSWGRLLAAWR